MLFQRMVLTQKTSTSAFLVESGKSEADLKAISLQPDAAQLDEMAEIIHPGTRTAVEWHNG